MGERGLSVVREKFSCEAQLQRVESLYARLLGESEAVRASPVVVAAAPTSAARGPDK
jgi:hypothetical protein